jgi:Ca2+-binding EF-hand superfamily protein
MALSPNASYGMTAALQLGGGPKVAKEKVSVAGERKEGRMMEQAQKIVEHLRKIQPDNSFVSKPERTIHELADTANKFLKKKAGGKNGKSVEKLFWNYDPGKRGSVRYDDLGEILVHAGSAIDKDESYMLAHHLDVGKTGMLPYTNMVKRLDEAKDFKDGKSMAALLAEKTAREQDAALKKRATKERKIKPKATKNGGGSKTRKKTSSNSLQSHLLKTQEKESQPVDVVSEATREQEASNEMAVAALKKKKKNLKEKKSTVSNKMLENSLVVQLQGKFSGLRFLLKKTDISKSGLVNRSEFNTALRHAGVNITKDELALIFERNANNVAVDSAIGLTHGKAVSIEDFVQKMRTRASAPAFAHLSGLTKQDAAQRREEMRVMRKVLDATGMAENALSVFREMQEPYKDWVEPDALREGLNKLGSNLDENEFATLVEKVDANGDGKIEMQEFDDYLHMAVSEHTDTELKMKRDHLANHGRYSQSFASNEILHTHLQPCYDKMSDSKVFRNENLKWSKLKYGLQDKRVAVLRAFQQSGYGVMDLQASQLAEASPEDAEKAVAIPELGERLMAAGAPLGDEDLDTLGRKMGFVEKDNHVTMQDFCEVVGIPLAVTKNSKGLVAGHPNAHNMDGGVFNSSSKSQVSHGTNATTMMLSSVDDTVLVKGNRKRLVPQTQFAHSRPGDSSRFWEMSHGVDETKRVVSMPRGGVHWDQGLSGTALEYGSSRGRQQSLAEATGGHGRRSSSAPATSRRAAGVGAGAPNPVSSTLRWVGNNSLAQYMSKDESPATSKYANTASRLNFAPGHVDSTANIMSLKKRLPRHPRPPPYATHN